MLLETSPIGIVISDGAGRIEDVNAEALRLFGYEREELVGQMIEILVPQRLQRAHAGHRSLYARDPRTRSMGAGMELFARRKDGTEFPIEVGLGPLATKEGVLVSSTIVDITARRKMEEQLRLSQRMDALGRLAGGVAHDFNNLLTVILGNSDVVVDSLPPGHPAIQKLEIIRKAGVSAADLTRQLLAFGRQQLVQPRILDLTDTLQKMEVLLRRLIGENIELKILLDSSLGAIKADPGQIEQILLNLAVNARDAMPKGGRLTIEARNVEIDESYREEHPAAIPGPYILLAVTDAGCGMDRETQLRIFDPFFTTKELGKGTGLGLATVYGIVKQAGGYIWVYSEIAQGSVFKVYLPRVERAAEPGKREREEEEVCNGSETILLAEDSDPLREMAREYLESVGYTVLEAASGKDALRAQCVLAGGRLENGVADAFQIFAGHFAQGVGVFGQEDRLAAIADLLLLTLAFTRFGRPLHTRQINFEDASLCDLAVDPDVAAGLFYDSVDGCQAQAGALPEFFSGEERIKNPQLRLAIHSAARVRDRQQYIGAWNGRRMFFPIALVYFDIARLDGKASALGHGVPRVHRQVQEYLLNLSGVGFDSAKRRIEQDFELDIFPDQATQQNLHFLQRICEIEDSGLNQLLAAESEELTGQVGCGNARLPDYFQFLNGGVTRWKGVNDDVRIPQDPGQQIVEIVGHAAGEPAEGVHPLRQPELLLHLFSRGGIHYRAGDEDTFLGGERPQTDFYGKFGAVLAAGKQLHAIAHGALARILSIQRAMPLVCILETLGQKN